MHWKRLAHAFLLSTGFCVLGAGCAAVDALVSSPAGSGADGTSPQRMAAIGRVFENQGRFAQAESMYRRALKSQPGNTIVRDRLQYLASRRKSGGPDSIERRTQNVIAVADSLGNRVSKTVQAESLKPRPQQQVTLPQPAIELVETVAVDVPVAVDVVQAMDTTPETELSAEPLISAIAAVVEPASQVPEIPEIPELGDFESSPEVHSGIQLAQLTEVAPRATGLVFAPGRSSHPSESGIETVSFDNNTTGWKTSARVITLQEVATWLESPQEFESDLLAAVRLGEDAGVKALATSALSAGSADPEVDATLRLASRSEDPLVQLTALESLIERNTLTTEDVATILTLASSNDSEIRLQSAGSLRNLVNSEWTAQCVSGLCGLIHDADPSVVVMAVTTLGDFGPSAEECREDLVQLGETTDNEFIADAVAHTLQRIPALQEAADTSVLPPVTSGSEFLPVVE